MTALRVLIGCETSGIARRAFASLGHDVWSCDIQPAEDGSNRHRQEDIRGGILTEGWDLLAVMHPPCTRLCNSGVRWLHERNLWADLDEAVALFAACWQAPIPRVAVENPVMHRHARERLPAGVPRPHIVQPWWFGHRETKATGWYLRGLPPLVPTDRIEPPADPGHRRDWNRVHRMPPGPDRARLRSRSYPGMMAAAAAQWAGPAEREAAHG